MKKILIPIVLLLAFMVQCTSKTSFTPPPPAKTETVEDEYFGVKISDPYRYMENLEDTTVQSWIKAQSDYARNILNSIPGRQSLIDKMFDFDKRASNRVTSLKITENDRYFYLKFTPDDETGKLCYRDGFSGTESLLFDPETYSTDSTVKYVIGDISPSHDGKKVAFSVAANGSESSEIVTIDVESGIIYPEKIDRCFASAPSWLPGNDGFIYNRLGSSDVHQMNRQKNLKCYVHIIGNEPSGDTEILSNEKNPELGIKPEEIPIVMYDKESGYLVAAISTVDNSLNVLYVQFSEQLLRKKIEWKRLISPSDQVYNILSTDKDLYLMTPKDAPNFKILKTSLDNPDIANAEVIVPEDPNRSINSIAITSDGLYYTLSENGIKETLYFIPNGEKTAKEIQFPFTAGSAIISSKNFKHKDLWVTIMGWTSDFQRYRYNPSDNKFTIENLSDKAEYPEFNDLVVEEIMVPSHDGVMVPVSLIYKKELKKDGKNPVLFFGYGAYGMSMNPFFSPVFLLWTLENGILAVAHVRGGGELGNQWHLDGYKTTKPNTWKDLIASAEFMVKEKYTSPKKIAIYSGSAGGILVGRAMTERPELFAAVIPTVGAMNTLRMENTPNGPVNTPEFGTVKDSVECMALLEMDSYHHLKQDVIYPATLVTAGMNDPRVIAWQPAKFAARLQAFNTSDRPMLLWTDYDAGHGIGNTKTKSFESMADVFSFALWQTGQAGFQVK